MNLPNRITLARVCLIPVFLFVYLVRPLGETPNMWLALVIFVVASATDAVDGHIARKYKLVTNFGKLMDPLADKLLVCSALVAFIYTGSLGGQFATWAVVVLISREFYISGLRQLALEQGKVLAALQGGKWKMGLQIALIVVVLLPVQMFSFEWLLYEPLISSELLSTLHNWVVLILLVITTVVSVLSAVDYTVKNKDVFIKQ